MSNNKKKSKKLGMPHGTASNKLRKMILFEAIKELGKDICFHCNKKIISINNFSIEHKIPWLNAEKGKELFFDLENIAFSHLKCNNAKGIPVPEQPKIICSNCGDSRVVSKSHYYKVSQDRRSSLCQKCRK